MVETEVISIMDEGLAHQIDILVSHLEYPGVLDNLSGVGATYEVIKNNIIRCRLLQNIHIIWFFSILTIEM